jgi:hypothetical protein
VLWSAMRMQDSGWAVKMHLFQATQEQRVCSRDVTTLSRPPSTRNCPPRPSEPALHAFAG